MALKLNLFVHGVPKGQKIWGPQEEDRIFLESFYSKKSNLDAQLQVDVMKIGKEVYCYYTYLRGGNMLDVDNRQGSYFALTIRINAYYNDLFNMYSILEASYQKFILGKILTSNESSSKYLVDDFQQSDDNLASLEKEIINYLSSFSNGSDFISLENFVTNSKLACQNINLLECSNKNVFSYIKEKGNISISPFHASKQFSDYVRKKEEEVEKMKLEAQKQIGEEKRKLEQQIQSIKAEYTTADKTISELNRQLELEKSNVELFKNDLELKNKKVTEYENLKQKFYSKEQEFIKIQNNLTAKLKEKENRSKDDQTKQPDNKKPDIVQNKINSVPLNYYLLLISILLTLLILLGFIFFSVNQSTGNKKTNEEINSKVDIIIKLIGSEKKSDHNAKGGQQQQLIGEKKVTAGSTQTTKLTNTKGSETTKPVSVKGNQSSTKKDGL
jgi:hypothetical protein